MRAQAAAARARCPATNNRPTCAWFGPLATSYRVGRRDVCDHFTRRSWRQCCRPRRCRGLPRQGIAHRICDRLLLAQGGHSTFAGLDEGLDWLPAISFKPFNLAISSAGTVMRTVKQHRLIGIVEGNEFRKKPGIKRAYGGAAGAIRSMETASAAGRTTQGRRRLATRGKGQRPGSLLICTSVTLWNLLCFLDFIIRK